MTERLCSFFLLFWSVVCLRLYELVEVVKLVDAPYYMLQIDLTWASWSFLAGIMTQVLIGSLCDVIAKTRSANFTQRYNRSISTFGQFIITLKLTTFYSFLNLSDLA